MDSSNKMTFDNRGAVIFLEQGQQFSVEKFRHCERPIQWQPNYINLIRKSNKLIEENRKKLGRILTKANLKAEKKANKLARKQDVNMARHDSSPLPELDEKVMVDLKLQAIIHILRKNHFKFKKNPNKKVGQKDAPEDIDSSCDSDWGSEDLDNASEEHTEALTQSFLQRLESDW